MSCHPSATQPRISEHVERRRSRPSARIPRRVESERLEPHLLGFDDVPVDGGLRRLARMGIRRLRRSALQLRRAQLHPGTARPAHRVAAGAERDIRVDGHPDVAAPHRLGAGRHAVRRRRRSHRPDADAHADDAPLLDRHGALRHRTERVAARPVPARRQPRHRRRVGGRRLDGRGGRARKAPHRSRGAALHLGALRARARHVSELRDCGTAVRRSPRGIVALRLPVRPAPGSRGPGRPLFREGARALGGRVAGHAATDGRRPVRTRHSPADDQRAHHGPDRACRMVELQRVHSRHRERARRGGSGRLAGWIRPRGWRSARVGRRRRRAGSTSAACWERS